MFPRHITNEICGANFLISTQYPVKHFDSRKLYEINFIQKFIAVNITIKNETL